MKASRLPPQSPHATISIVRIRERTELFPSRLTKRKRLDTIAQAFPPQKVSVMSSYGWSQNSLRLSHSCHE